jgi:hypothetical protein
MMRLSAVVLCSLFTSVALAADVEIAGMKSKAPDTWKEEPPSNKMRLTQFKLPRADGDPADAELVVFMFPGGSGSVEQNLERQVRKFKPAAGQDKVESKVEKIKVGPYDATYQDVKGTFLSKFPPFAPDAKVTEKPEHRQLYVLFAAGDKGEFYMTLLGPAKTVEKHKKDFDEFLKNFK